MLQVIITVLAETDALSAVPAVSNRDDDVGGAELPALIFNLHCPKLSQSVDVDLPNAMQKIMIGEVFSQSKLELLTMDVDIPFTVGWRLF